MPLPLPASITRFVENEERFDRVLNATGGYTTSSGASVPTWQDARAAMAADLQTLLNRTANRVSFIEAGMDPTGVANCATILNNLITTATAEGKTIYGPPGVYRMNASLTYISNMKLVMDPQCVLMFYVTTNGGINGCVAPRYSVSATPENWEIHGGIFRKPDRGRLFKPGVGSTIYNGNTLVLMGRNYKVFTTVDCYTGRAVNIHNSFDGDVVVDCFRPRPTGEIGSEDNDTGPGGIRIFSGEDVRVHDSWVESGDDAFQFTTGDTDASSYDAPIRRCSYDRCRGVVYVGRLMIASSVATAGIKPTRAIEDCSFRDVRGVTSNWNGIEVYSAGTANTEDDLDGDSILRGLLIDDCTVIGINRNVPEYSSVRRGHGLRVLLGGRGSSGITIRGTHIEGFRRSTAWIQNAPIREQVGRVRFEGCYLGNTAFGNRTILIQSSSDVIFARCEISGPDASDDFPEAIIVQTDNNPPGPGVLAECRRIIFELCDFTNLHSKTVVAKYDYSRNFLFNKNRYRALEDGAKIFVFDGTSSGIIEKDDYSAAFLSDKRTATLTNPFSFVSGERVVRVYHPSHGIRGTDVPTGVLVEFVPSVTTGTLTDPFAVVANERGVVITHPAHGRAKGDVITFSNVTNISGLTTDLNGSFDIIATTSNTYTIGADAFPTESNAAFGGSVNYLYSRRINGYRFDKIFKVAFYVDADNYAVYLPNTVASNVSNVGGSIGVAVLPYSVPASESTTVVSNVVTPHDRSIVFRDNIGYSQSNVRIQTDATQTRVSDNGGTVYMDLAANKNVVLKSAANTPAIPSGWSCKYVKIGTGNVSFVVEGSDTLITSNGTTTITGVGDECEIRLISQIDGVRRWYARIVP